MPRKGPVPKRDILADPKFNSIKVAKFINQIMQRGKKSVAEKIMYSALGFTGKHPAYGGKQCRSHKQEVGFSGIRDRQY